MTYQLPEPAIHAPFYKEYKTVYQGDYFTADQMQQAYKVGRESMRVKCLQECSAEATDNGTAQRIEKAIEGIK